MLLQEHLNALVAGGGDRLADVIRADGQLAVAAVDEHRQLDPGGPAEVDDLVERGPDGAPGIENVVDQDHGASVDGAGNLSAAQHGLGGDGGGVVAGEGAVPGP